MKLKSAGTGRFETRTETRIKTEHGTVLRVNWYLHDSKIEEFRIRPKCHVCGKDMGCLCFDENNCENPFDDAISNLQREWICDDDQCVIEDVKTNDPEYYDDLVRKHCGNTEAIAADIRDDWSGLDEGAFCGV